MHSQAGLREERAVERERDLKPRDAHQSGDKTLVGRKHLNWPHPEASSLNFTVAG